MVLYRTASSLCRCHEVGTKRKVDVIKEPPKAFIFPLPSGLSLTGALHGLHVCAKSQMKRSAYHQVLCGNPRVL